MKANPSKAECLDRFVEVLAGAYARMSDEELQAAIERIAAYEAGRS